MSYDVHIGGDDFNYTYNVSSMWYASEPDCGIRAIYGLSGENAIPVLRKMRDHMENNWADMEAMNPPNGWGSADGAWDFLNRLIAASRRNKTSIWEGD